MTQSSSDLLISKLCVILIFHIFSWIMTFYNVLQYVLVISVTEMTFSPEFVILITYTRILQICLRCVFQMALITKPVIKILQL